MIEAINENAIPAGARFLPQYRDPTLTPSATNPGALPDAFLRPIAGYGDISIIQTTGHSKYDSLQLQLTRRFTGGFEMAGSYTFAKGSVHHGAENAPNILQYDSNPLPSRDDRSDIQEHVMVVSYTYEIPNGSHAFGGNSVAKAFLDSWRLSGISTFGTGGRGDVTATYSPAFEFTGGGEGCFGYQNGGTTAGGQPYDVVGSLELPSDQRSVDMWFNTANVVPAKGVGDVGNGCERWKFRMPGWNNHDLTLFKDMRLKHNQLLEYRWEIYNLFNQVSFNAVNTAATFNPTTGAQTNTNFGKVTSARTERRMQMSLRYRF